MPMEDRGRIAASAAAACRQAGVELVTGDTKVVNQSHGDGVFINTSGLGLVPERVDVRPDRARPGDVVVVSGAIGVHGIAIMSVREGLDFETTIESDTAPLRGLVAAMLAARFGQFAAFQAVLSTVYGELGRYRDAAVHARLALDLDPKTADHYLLAAYAYMAAGYYSLAYRARQQWLRSAPRDHPALAEMRRLDEEYRRGAEVLQAQYRLRDTKVATEAGYRLDEGRWALAQVAMMPDSTVPNLGASGAISGVLGAYILMYPRARVTVVMPLFFFFPFFDSAVVQNRAARP